MNPFDGDIEDIEGPYEQIKKVAVNAGSSGSSDNLGEIEILLNNSVITGQTKEVDIGDGVNLSVRPKRKNVSMSTVKWTVPGKKVLTYTTTTQVGKKIAFPEKALDNSALKFYWYEGGEMNITVDVQLKDGEKVSNVTAQCKIKVNRPNLTMGGTQSPTYHVTIPIPLETDTAYKGVYTTSVSIPRQGDKGEGKTCWLQLITFQNAQLYKDADLKGFSEQTGLDQEFPYAAGTPERFVDNPSVNPTYNDFTAIAVQVRFKTYLMYKSKATDSIRCRFSLPIGITIGPEILGLMNGH